jgi:predicted RNA-binding protein with PUA-like domain
MCCTPLLYKDHTAPPQIEGSMAILGDEKPDSESSDDSDED